MTVSPRYRRLDRDERQEQILGVARRLFTEMPYADVSTTAIAEAAGVRRGLIHYYFGAKRDLFLTVVRDLIAGISYVAPPTVDPDLGRDQAIDLCVRIFLDASAANSEVWFAAIDAEGFGSDPELVRIMNRARDVTVETMLGVLRVVEPTETTRAVLRAYSGLAEAATREWLQRGALDREQTHLLLAGTLRAVLAEVTPALDAAQANSAES